MKRKKPKQKARSYVPIKYSGAGRHEKGKTSRRQDWKRRLQHGEYED